MLAQQSSTWACPSLAPACLKLFLVLIYILIHTIFCKVWWSFDWCNLIRNQSHSFIAPGLRALYTNILYSLSIAGYSVNLVQKQTILIKFGPFCVSARKPLLWDLALVFTPLTLPLTDDGQKYMLVFRHLGVITSYPRWALMFLKKTGNLSNFFESKN